MDAHAPDRRQFQIAIICVLELEGDAVEALMTETFTNVEKASHDENFYVTGIFGGKHVVLVSPRGMGTLNVANTARDMRQSFPGIKLALLVGVAGGAPYTPEGDEILLGDVLVSTQVVQYDFGRNYSDGIKIKDAVADTLGRPHTQLGNFLRHLRRRKGIRSLVSRTNQYIEDAALSKALEHFVYPGHGNDRLFPTAYPHRHVGDDLDCICRNCNDSSCSTCDEAKETKCDVLKCDMDVCLLRARIANAAEASDASRGVAQRNVPIGQRPDDYHGPDVPAKVHFGNIASSSQVLKNSPVRDKLMRERQVVGFEMEGAGSWDTFPTIVVKSVCDYADGHKNKIWQPYAGAIAACCAKAIVEAWQTSATERLGQGTVAKYPSSSNTPGSAVLSIHSDHELAKSIDEIQRGLFTTEPDDDLYDARQRARNGRGPTPGTCDWLSEHEVYLDWASRRSPQLLSLTGPPGIGKSTLSAELISHWQHKATEKSYKSAFFFCDASNEKRRTSLSVVSSILRQIIVQQSTSSTNAFGVPTSDYLQLFAGLRDDYRNQGQSLFSNLTTLSRRLQELLSNPALGETYILIDALDECEEPSRQTISDLLSKICDQGQSLAEPGAKFIVTCRPGYFDAMDKRWPDTARAIMLGDEREVAKNVHRFIDLEMDDISALRQWPLETTQTIKRLMRAKSGGTFLWVALAISSIRNARADNVLELMEDLPPGLNAIYIRILQQIPLRDRNRAAQVLHYVLAGVLGLTTTTSAGLLASSEIGQQANRIPSVSRMKQLQSGWKACEPLLRVDSRKNRLRPIHQSVVDFFKTVKLPEDLILFRFDAAQTQRNLLHCCRQFLSCTELQAIATDVRLLAAGRHGARSNCWGIMKAEHYRFLAFAFKCVEGFHPAIQGCLRHGSRFVEEFGITLQSERTAFWQSVWDASGDRPSLYEKPGLLQIIKGHTEELAHIAISKRHDGLVIVLDAAQGEQWWASYFGLGRVVREFQGFHAARAVRAYAKSNETQKFGRVIIDAFLVESFDFLAALAGCVLKGLYRGQAMVEAVIAVSVAQLISEGQGQAGLRLLSMSSDLIEGFGSEHRMLNYLAAANEPGALQYLVESGYKADELDHYEERSILQDAASAGSLEGFMRLAESEPLLLRHSMGDSRSPLLHCAAEGGCLQILQYVLEATDLGVSQKLPKDDAGRTPLHLAAENGSRECAVALIEMFPDAIRSRDRKGSTPLHLAAERGAFQIMQCLLDAGATLCTDHIGRTPLHSVFDRLGPSDRQSVLSILWPVLTAEMVQNDSANLTLLMSAAKKGSLEHMRSLLKLGADVNRVDEEGMTALHLAAEAGKDPKVVDLLLQADVSGGNTYIQDYKQRVPLHHAIEAGRLEIAKRLIAADIQGTSLELKDRHNDRPLDTARCVVIERRNHPGLYCWPEETLAEAEEIVTFLEEAHRKFGFDEAPAPGHVYACRCDYCELELEYRY